MTPRRRKRLGLAGLLLLGAVGATTLLLSAFRENLVYFYTPSEIAAGEAPAARTFRVGGLVKDGSVERIDQSLRVHFVVTDTTADVPIRYEGVLPDLFREGQGIVADGRLDEAGRFVADRVLAKHDENYMPPEAAEALKRAEANRGSADSDSMEPQ